VISDALATLATDEMTPEAYNVHYLQRHSGNAGAVLGAAKALQILGGPRDEVEGIVFGILNPEVDLSLKTALDVWSFLQDTSSPRVDEFRLACDKKFNLSTVFKTPDELAVMYMQRPDTPIKTWAEIDD
jgi:peptide alpha-N-acetyltransferase